MDILAMQNNCTNYIPDHMVLAGSHPVATCRKHYIESSELSVHGKHTVVGVCLEAGH